MDPEQTDRQMVRGMERQTSLEQRQMNKERGRQMDF
jgi:hypothetical protein